MDAWFDMQTAAIIERIMGGTIGIWGGCIVGGMSGFYINKGLKKLAFGLYGFTFFAGLVIFVIGIVALFTQQPTYIIRPFLICGGITAVVIGGVFPIIRKRFAEREKQIMAIEDL